MEWLLFLLLGGFAGTLAGLFGVGGGAVLVPLLMLVFDARGFAPEAIAHLAIGTSFATIVFTSLGSIWGHHRKANIDWLLWRQLAFGLAIGVTLGSWIASQISSPHLEPVIGLFFALVALQMGFGLAPSGRVNLPSPVGLSFAGFGIGGVSSFFGIGGGSLTVPWLRFCNLPIHRAVGTSAACGLPIAIFGALSFWWFGLKGEYGQGADAGYIYIPAFAGIVLTSVPAAAMGAKIGRLFSEQMLTRCFAFMLFCVGGFVLWRSLMRLVAD